MTQPTTASDVDARRVTIHLTAQATVSFEVSQLWPLHADYARFGPDLAAFAQEIARRLRQDGYVGYSMSEHRITMIPISAIKRIDFSDHD